MFKKTLAAVAVLGAFAGSAFAANVTMYGIIDTGLGYTSTGAILFQGPNPSGFNQMQKAALPRDRCLLFFVVLCLPQFRTGRSNHPESSSTSSTRSPDARSPSFFLRPSARSSGASACETEVRSR